MHTKKANSIFTIGIILVISIATTLISLTGTVYGIPPVYRTVLPNGVTVLVCEEHSLPVITVQLLMDVGSVKDPPGYEGTSYITGKALFAGTKKRSALDIAKEIDFIGASIHISPGKETTTLSLRVLKKDLKKGMDILTDMLTEATFPVEEVEKEIENALGLIESIEENPGEVAVREFQRLLYHNTGYGHPVEGTKESLKKIKKGHLLDFYKKYYRAENAILVVVGDITIQGVNEEIIPLIEKIPEKRLYEKNQKIRYNENTSTVVIDRNISQTNIILGHSGITRDNPDFYAISVLNQIFGSGGFASRLTEEIRNKRGLAYSVYGYFDTGKHTGSFQIVLQTKNENTKKAISILTEEMKRIRETLVTEMELERAKKYLVGSFPLRLDTQAKLASFLLQVEYHGLGVDYPVRYPELINSVSREDILRVAKKYIKPEQLLIVVVGNKKEAKIDDHINIE